MNLGLTTSATMAWAVFGPWLASAAIVALGRWPKLRETVTLLTAVLLFLLVLTLLPAVLAGEHPHWRLLEPLPGLSLAFTLEPLGMLFALLASGLWMPTAVYAIGYVRAHHERHQTRFFACFPIALACTLGVALAGNLLTLFLFYELLTLSTYPLVAHAQSEEALRGARVYLGILLTTSISLFLFAMLWVWQATGTLDFRPGGILAGRVPSAQLPWLLALFAFGIGKAALMPVHRWLPAAMVAPTPVSALLHAVAVVKAGVFTLLKVILYIFGPGLLLDTGASRWLAWVAAFTVVTAAVIALRQDNLKRRLAYSTVSQLAYISLGAALVNRWSVAGAAMHMVMHGFAKITLFFCAGAILVATHRTRISELDGLGRRMPFTFGAFFIAALSIIGLPPAGGLWSKYWLTMGALQGGQFWLMAIYLGSSLLSLAYLMPIVARGFLLPAGDPEAQPGLHEAPWTCVAPLCLTALGCVALFFAVAPLLHLLQPLLDAVLPP